MAAPRGGGKGGGRGGGFGGFGGFGGGGPNNGGNIFDLYDPTAPQLAQQPNDKPADVVKYDKSTPEEDATEIADAQKSAASVAEQFRMKFIEVQTPHFIIFTDWEGRDQTVLKDALEGAYTAVAKQFAIPAKETVFVGKLPVYVFKNKSEYLDMADKVDHLTIAKDVVGYFLSKSDVAPHLVMTRPTDITGPNAAQAQKNWGFVLTHELTHAFISRYHTNRPLPNWLSEGLAELVAHTQFPHDKTRQIAKTIAGGTLPVSDIFNEKDSSIKMYPVMMTMTEALIQSDPKKFMKYLNEIKDGADAEDSLRTNYNVTYDGLENAWRNYMKTAK